MARVLVFSNKGGRIIIFNRDCIVGIREDYLNEDCLVVTTSDGDFCTGLKYEGVRARTRDSLQLQRVINAFYL